VVAKNNFNLLNNINKNSMKKIVYVLIGILLLFGCNSPEKLPEPFQGIFTDTDAEIFFEYNSITSDRLTNFFVDNFDNNNSEWYTGFNANLGVFLKSWICRQFFYIIFRNFCELGYQ
jgi:hypothetical protein